MNWLLFAVLAQALWAGVNHLDKHLVTRYFNGGVGAVLIFTAIVNAMFLPPILFLNPEIISTPFLQAAIATSVGILYVVMSVFYFYAIREEEPTKISVLWQLTTPMTYLLGVIFLNEFLTGKQTAGAIIILLGGLVTMLRHENRKFSIQRRPLLLMVFAVICLSISSIIFKSFALEFSFWDGIFFEIFGAFISGIFLFCCVRSYRKEFLQVLSINTKNILGLNLSNEFLQLSGQIFFRQASLLVPVALVQSTNTLNSVFVFLYAFILSSFFPNLSHENFSRSNVLQKILGIIIVGIGIVLIQL